MANGLKALACTHSHAIRHLGDSAAPRGDRQRHVVLGLRAESHRDLRDGAKCAPRTGYEADEVEARDILDDASTSPHDIALARHELAAEHMIARCAERRRERS